MLYYEVRIKKAGRNETKTPGLNHQCSATTPRQSTPTPHAICVRHHDQNFIDHKTLQENPCKVVCSYIGAGGHPVDV